ncbi:FmdB family zinc ribbon protein [Microbacterium binotii]|uniref:FmdB family zinc ribbon protein n=1 Tax=Microbacterium binotii TaxID=462710 RepID=UPI001F278C28|nr:FmdB family zinc ribbon protein [Microbacterium binotii]UIN31614.1 FmdB family transcriptional regulator [Microbacterium binotii]
MPTYAYACKTCGHRFDTVQSFSDPALTECPSCGGVLRKEYGSIGVTFNGSGFYRTDSRAGASGSSATGTSGGDSGSSGASSSTGATAPTAPAAPAAS